MDKISAKQIEGIVTDYTDQVISGKKIFMEPVYIKAPENGFYYGMCMDGNYIYWVKTHGELNENGNMRIGSNPQSQIVTFEKFESGSWQSIPYLSIVQ